MSIAPKAGKVKKKSPAQLRAFKSFAAAGRASQARSRSAFMNAHHGRKPPVSKARHQAAINFAAAGRAAQAAKRAGKAAPKKRAAIATELVLPGSSWPSGCNDIAPTCASVAVACHMQAMTGLTPTDEEILKLHELAGGGYGVSISDVLEALSAHWPALAGGRVRLMSWFRADESFLVAGMVVGIALGHEGHAVLSAPNGMISWGQFMAWDGEPEEAWCLEWSV